MIQDAGPNHFYATDFPVFNEERLRNQDAGRPVESRILVGPTVGENAFAYGALVKHAVRPDNAALPVHNRIAAAMDVLNHVIEPPI